MKTPEQKGWRETLRNLKCVNGAMYFGSVEDDSCDCKSRCQNEQTYAHALEELESFIERTLHEEREEMVKTLQSELRDRIYSFTDHCIINQRSVDAGNITPQDRDEMYMREINQILDTVAALIKDKI